MYRSICLLCIAFVFSSGCDTQVEEPVSEFSINIGEYTDEIWAVRNIEVPRIGTLILPEELAVDLQQFPNENLKISSSGFGYGREYDERLGPELTRSIYLLLVPEGHMPQLFDAVYTVPQPLDKKASTDSINLDVYAFIVERPEVNYPEVIPVDFTIDDFPYTLEVRPDQHMISIEDQVIEKGVSFGDLPVEEGIVVDIESEIFDRSLIPAVVLHRAEVYYSQEDISLTNYTMVGMAFDSTYSAPKHKYLRHGMQQYKIIEDTEVRAFLLKR